MQACAGVSRSVAHSSPSRDTMQPPAVGVPSFGRRLSSAARGRTTVVALSIVLAERVGRCSQAVFQNQTVSPCTR